MSASTRLDKFLASATGMPRSHALTHIRSGRIAIDGEVVRDPAAKVVPETQTVLLEGQVLRPFHELLLVMHKPVGVITSTERGPSRTVMDLVPPPFRHKDLAPVGRLDKDTTGLLLLTTDGTLNHRLSHPRRHVPKVYVADLDQPLRADAEKQLADGITLSDGPCLPAKLERLGMKRVRLTLQEGRFHQVKRMMHALGSEVLTLHRERIGQFPLPANLAPGQVRELTADELEMLLSAE